jgi:hypothetical protein
MDANLVIKDAVNSTVWLAPTHCPSGTLLKPWAQCGGTSPLAPPPGAGSASNFSPRDGQYLGTCCPTGWQCYRQTSASWACGPSPALDSCAGPQKLPPGRACGGLSACGLDGTCPATTGCCQQGSYCQRLDDQQWLCMGLPARGA